MGRYLSTAATKVVYYGLRDVLPNYGSGAFRFFGASGTFTVPPLTTEVRVTALGAGGGAAAVRTPCICCYGCVWCWTSLPTNCFVESATPTGLCWSLTFPCVGQASRCWSGYHGCLNQLNNFCFGGGGGGGAYVIATVPVTSGCSCCIVVGAAGTHCALCTLSLNAECSCLCNCLTTGSAGAGGFSCFPNVCAQGGVGGCLGCCDITGGCGGNGFVTGSAVCVAIKQGNTGCNGCILCNVLCLGCCGYYTGSTLNASCTVCQAGAIPAIVSYGGASGSPVGPGGGTGPFPSTYAVDVFGCRGFDGSTCTESSLSTKWNNNIRWPGEVILSTSRSDTIIAGTAPGFPAATTYCVNMYGGAYVAALASQAAANATRLAGCCGGGAGPVGCGFLQTTLTKSYSSVNVTCNCKGGTYIQNTTCTSNGTMAVCACYTVGGQGGCPGSGFVVVEF